MRRSRVLAISAAAIVVGAAPIAARAADAPPSEATGTAASVADVATVGRSGAHADGGGASGTSEALHVGAPLPPTSVGGSQSGRGRTSGSSMQVVGGPATVWVLPWRSEVTGSGASNHGHGDSAAAAASIDGTPLDGTSASVLRSDADADYNGAASSGRSSSDAIVVVIGKNDVILNVLHADADSAGRGQSYLAAVNGNAVPVSDQTRALCSGVPSNVVSVACLSTTGGTASQQSVAAAASVSGGRSLAAVSSVSGSQLAAGPQPAAARAPSSAPSTGTQAGAAPATGVTAAARAPRSGGTLPLTGTNAAVGLLVGLSLMLLGADVVAVARVTAARRS